MDRNRTPARPAATLLSPNRWPFRPGSRFSGQGFAGFASEQKAADFRRIRWVGPGGQDARPQVAGNDEPSSRKIFHRMPRALSPHHSKATRAHQIPS